MEAEQGRHASDLELVERAQHPHAGVLAVDAVDDQLRDHRVVEAGDLGAGDDPGIDAYAGAGRLGVGGDPTGRGQEALADVLGVDAALDRVPVQRVRPPARTDSGSPAATRICSRTRSMPVTSSVTVCSTWIRVFISMK